MVISQAGFFSEHKSARSHKVNDVSRCCLVVLSIRTQASGPQFPTSPCRARFFFSLFLPFYLVFFISSLFLSSIFLPFFPSLSFVLLFPLFFPFLLHVFFPVCPSFLSYSSFLISFFFSPFLSFLASTISYFSLFTSRFVLFILAHKRSATLRYELSLLGP